MEKLINGLLQYRASELPRRRELFARLGQGQQPDSLFLTCSDSRIDPNLLVQGEPGDLFVVRTVGNLIAPARDDGSGVAIGDVSEAAAAEYALLVLGVKDIVICGHSKCGAMDAVYRQAELPDTPNLREWLEHGLPSRDRVALAQHIDPALPDRERLSQVNVLQQIDHLRSYDLVRRREAAGEVTLHAWWFDVATGDVYIFDEARGGFVVLDEAQAERVFAREIRPPRLTLPLL